MAWILGVTVVIQKPPVVTVRTGESVTMECNSAVDGPRIYKQIPRGVPQFVLNFYHSFSAPKYGSGFSSPKFTASHQSNSDYRWSINDVEVGDSAVYYCATWDSSLTVTSNLRPPVLTVFPPSSVELQSNKATLVCLSSQSGAALSVTAPRLQSMLAVSPVLTVIIGGFSKSHIKSASLHVRAVMRVQTVTSMLSVCNGK
uniref:Immunoglobulin domain-containing protein n=1 Tax=Acanthochromis polyacanthus TaxID=80966 RepID=A0A3Q1FI89_9TELE